MTTLDLSQHPELSVLVAELRKGEVVVFTDHGTPVAEMFPTARRREYWKARLDALHQSFTSPSYPGNSVVDMREESR